MKKSNLLLIALACIMLTGCTQPKDAEKALMDAGYHPIYVGGYGWFQCSDKDVYATQFKAYSPDSSRIVTGCVCAGYFKGKTIRLN